MTSAARVHLESLLAELRTAAASLPSSIPSTPLRHHSFLLLLRDSSDPLPPSALHEILVRIWPASIPPTDVTRGEAGVALVVDALRRSIATIGAGSERVDVVMLENWVLKFQVAVGKAITNAAPPTLKAEPGSPATCPLSEASRKRPIDNVDGPSAPRPSTSSKMRASGKSTQPIAAPAPAPVSALAPAPASVPPARPQRITLLDLKTRLFALDNFEYYPAKHVPPLEFFITAINNPSDRTKDTFWLHSDRKGGLAAHRVVLDPTMFSCVSYPTDVNSDEPVISFDFYPNPADSVSRRALETLYTLCEKDYYSMLESRRTESRHVKLHVKLDRGVKPEDRQQLFEMIEGWRRMVDIGRIRYEVSQRYDQGLAAAMK